MLRETKGVVALRCSRLERNVRHEGAGRRVKGFTGGILVGLRSLDGWIVG